MSRDIASQPRKFLIAFWQRSLAWSAQQRCFILHILRANFDQLQNECTKHNVKGKCFLEQNLSHHWCRSSYHFLSVCLRLSCGFVSSSVFLSVSERQLELTARMHLVRIFPLFLVFLPSKYNIIMAILQCKLLVSLITIIISVY